MLSTTLLQDPRPFPFEKPVEKHTLATFLRSTRRFIGRTCHLAMFGMVRALPKANRGIGLAARSFAAKGAGAPMLPAVSVSPEAPFPEGVGAQVPPRPRRASIGRIR